MDFMQDWYEEAKEKGYLIGKAEGRLEGRADALLKLYKKGKTVEEIADLFDFKVIYVQKMIDRVM